MSATDTGGPAFPAPDAGESDFGTEYRGTYRGLTVRDYFAAKAMPQIYQRVDDGGFDRVAKLSYQLADAMLKARSA